ncbi:MAG: histidine kinase dimerization/phospho-acceptor domain-containing protein [Pseudomonadota bacterium]
MTAMAISRPGRGQRSLLGSYTEKCADAIRRNQSTIALRAARVDAELAYRARGAFLASMNHELRTPLNAITGFAGLLKQSEDMNLTPEQRGEYLDYILQSADLLLSHINTILQIADAESGGTKLARRAFDVGDVIDQVLEGLNDSGVAGQLSVSQDVPSALPPVNADPDKIAVALQHLIGFVRGGVEGQVEL